MSGLTGSYPLAQAYRAKARAELERADAIAPGAVAWWGDELAEIVAVKGLASEADLEAGRAGAGEEEPLRKALDVLGLAGSAVLFTVARPGARISARRVRARLALQVESVDPRIVLALDAEAAVAIAEALGTQPLPPGRPVTRQGRLYVALDGFEASLGDEARKKRVWAQLKALAD